MGALSDGTCPVQGSPVGLQNLPKEPVLPVLMSTPGSVPPYSLLAPPGSFPDLMGCGLSLTFLMRPVKAMQSPQVAALAASLSGDMQAVQEGWGLTAQSSHHTRWASPTDTDPEKPECISHCYQYPRGSASPRPQVWSCLGRSATPGPGPQLDRVLSAPLPAPQSTQPSRSYICPGGTQAGGHPHPPMGCRG